MKQFELKHAVLLTDGHMTRSLSAETWHDIFCLIDRPAIWDGIIHDYEAADYSADELENFRIFENMSEDDVRKELEHVFGTSAQ